MKALYPGTFNPPTLGHLDIIERAARFCGELHVAIGVNSHKNDALFSTKEKEALLLAITKHLPHVAVVSFSGLVAEYAKKHDFDLIIRGVRSCADFEYERQMAWANRELSGIETLFLAASEKFVCLDSSLVREIGSHGKPLHAFVPKEIAEVVSQRLAEKRMS